MWEKHLLYLTNHQLISVVSNARGLGPRKAFSLDAAGRNAFDVHLGNIEKIPAYLLTDLIEEDFRSDTIPHVSARDRHALLERKLSQAYRATPYRHATLQGREDDGRRDDRILYTAITNAELLRPITAILDGHKTPLMGIYSAPLLATRLLHYLRLELNHVLMVSLVGENGVRQNYFQNGMIKFSRLTPIGDEGQPYPSELIAQEVGKTWQYLDSMRYLPRSESLPVFVLCHPAEQARYTSALQGSPQLQYRQLDITQVAAMLGQNRLPENSDSADILLHLLAEKIPPNHYAPREDTRYAAIWNAKQKLYYTAAGLFGAGAVWTLFNLFSATGLGNDTEQLQSQVRALTVQQQTIMNRFPKDIIDPDDMRDAVDHYQATLADAPSPASLMLRVSEALNRSPAIQLRNFSWMASDNPDALPAADAVKTTAPAAADSKPATTQNHGARYDIALLEGNLSTASVEPRSSLNEINRLLQHLNGIKGVKAQAMKWPLDISPGGKLAGKFGAGASAAKSDFSIKVVLNRTGG
jgi:hypothetical protein